MYQGNNRYKRTVTRPDFSYSTAGALHIKESVNHFNANHVTPWMQEC